MTEFTNARLNLTKEWQEVLINRLRNLGYMGDGEGAEDLNSFDDEVSNYLTSLIEADCGAEPPKTFLDTPTFTIRVPIPIRVDEVTMTGSGEIGYAIVVDDEEKQVFSRLQDARADLFRRIMNAPGPERTSTEAGVMVDYLTREHVANLPPPPVQLDISIHPDAYEAILNYALSMGIEPEHYDSNRELVEYYIVVLACTHAGYL